MRHRDIILLHQPHSHHNLFLTIFLTLSSPNYSDATSAALTTIFTFNMWSIHVYIYEIANGISVFFWIRIIIGTIDFCFLHYYCFFYAHNTSIIKIHFYPSLSFYRWVFILFSLLVFIFYHTTIFYVPSYLHILQVAPCHFVSSITVINEEIKNWCVYKHLWANNNRTSTL